MKSGLKPTILILGSEDDLNLINLIEWLNFHRANLFFMNTSIMEIEIIDYGFDQKKLTIEVNDSVNIYEVDFTDLKVTFSRGNRIRFKKMNNPLDKDHDNGLSINKLLFSETKNYNSYFNRKLFIGEHGEIKCSPESEENFGQIETMYQLLDIVLIEDFQKYWKVSKDMCDVCKDCEFRRMCVDNRIPHKRNDGSYYFVQECNYNPYIAKWKNEDGYVSLAVSGVDVSSEKLNIDHDRIATINKRIWGD